MVSSLVVAMESFLKILYFIHSDGKVDIVLVHVIEIIIITQYSLACLHGSAEPKLAPAARPHFGQGPCLLGGLL